MPRKSTQTTAIEPSEQTAVDLGLIVLKDGQHQDDAAEREAMERGQAASEAMDENANDDEPKEADVKSAVLAERNDRIIKMRRDGVPLGKIAGEVGLSSTRVWRILSAAGVKAPAEPKAKKAPAKKK